MVLFHRTVVLSMIAGCGFTGREAPDANQGSDAPVLGDAPIESRCETWTPFDGPPDPCASSLGAPADLSIEGNASYNTGSGVLTVNGMTTTLPGTTLPRTTAGDLRVVNLSGLRVAAGAKLTVTGTLAVLFLVHGDVTVAGTIDGSALPPAQLQIAAPGAESLLCNAPILSLGSAGMKGTDDKDAGGGGGGGGFGEAGGNGGDGFGRRLKGAKGAKSNDYRPLRGGCSGGRGGDNEDDESNDAGLPGGGGGGLAISARGMISVTGTILANGASGRGGASMAAGGGGGGSGGTIALDGARVGLAPTAALCANGGGGGEGSGGAIGNSGQLVNCTIGQTGGGATGSEIGGDGGAGGAVMQPSGSNANNGANAMGLEGGGGGGGGGVGWILLRARSPGGLNNTSVVVSPEPTPL